MLLSQPQKATVGLPFASLHGSHAACSKVQMSGQGTALRIRRMGTPQGWYVSPPQSRGPGRRLTALPVKLNNCHVPESERSATVLYRVAFFSLLNRLPYDSHNPALISMYVR